MPDSMYNDLLLLRDLNFFPSLDPNQSSLYLASDQSPDECPLTEVIDDCLSSLFGKWAWHGPGDCDVDCPQVTGNTSNGHLNTFLIEVPLQDTLQNQTVRVTEYWLNLGTYLHSTVCLVAIIWLYIVSMYGSTCKFPHYTTLPRYLHW